MKVSRSANHYLRRLVQPNCLDYRWAYEWTNTLDLPETFPGRFIRNAELRLGQKILFVIVLALVGSGSSEPATTHPVKVVGVPSSGRLDYELLCIATSLPLHSQSYRSRYLIPILNYGSLEFDGKG